MLIFLHGFLGDPEDWAPLIANLPYPCYAPPLPGHGGYPVDWDLTQHLLDYSHGYSPILIGYSLGGRIALEIARRFPDQFAHLILLSAHPGLLMASEGEKRRAEENKWLSLLCNHPIDLFLDEWYAQPLFASLRTRTDLFQQVLERRKQNDPHCLAQILQRYPLMERSPLPHRTLLLHGAEDQKYAELYSPFIPHFPVHAIAEAGHSIHLEAPIICSHIIKQWIEKA